MLCETRLERFADIVVFHRAELIIAGIDVVLTFRRPHATIAHANLDSLVNGLHSSEHGDLRIPTQGDGT